MWSSLGIQRRVIQTNYTTRFLYSVWLETTHKPSNVATAKNFFSSMYVIVTNCFDKHFLFHVITGRHCFHQSLSLFWGSFQPPFSCFLWKKWFKRSPCFIFCLHNNNAMLKPKFQNEALIDHTRLIFLTTFIFWCSTLFLIDENIFKKLKTSVGVCFF